jgi:hypothetical protein
MSYNIYFIGKNTDEAKLEGSYVQTFQQHFLSTFDDEFPEASVGDEINIAGKIFYVEVDCSLTPRTSPYSPGQPVTETWCVANGGDDLMFAYSPERVDPPVEIWHNWYSTSAQHGSYPSPVIEGDFILDTDTNIEYTVTHDCSLLMTSQHGGPTPGVPPYELTNICILNGISPPNAFDSGK